MNNTELYFERPALLFILIPVILLLVGSFFFLPGRRRKSARRIAALVIHCTIAFILTALLSGIGLRSTGTKQAAMILVDRSASMGEDPSSIDAGVNELLRYFGEEIPAGVVAFGGDTTLELSLGENGVLTDETVVKDATDIDSAVRYALTLLPDDSAKRIVIFSDGNETDGDARDAARMLRTMGVRVDTIYYPGGDRYDREAEVSQIEGASTVKKGERLRMAVTVNSTYETKASLWITDNGSFVNTVDLDLHQGSNVVDVSVTPREEGEHIYAVRLRIDEGDALEINNSMMHAVTVTGNPKILLVSRTSTEGQELKRMMSKEASIDVLTPYRLPSSIVDLCRYDGVILSNIAERVLPGYFSDLLHAYVSRFGKPVLFVGGDSAFSLGGMKGGAYEDMLPVNLDYQKSKTERALSMLLVIDCSRSMGTDNALALAKQSAIRCLETVSEEDYVGVIAFWGEAEVVKSIGKCTPSYKDELSRAISGISIGAGTCYEPALELAIGEMSRAKTPVKHVIFLSDGQPSDHKYIELTEKLVDNGVTVSTIGLRYNSDILPAMAKKGLGRYNYVSTVDELPSIMLSEAKLVAASPMISGKFKVEYPQISALTVGIAEDELAQVSSYIGSIPKEDAKVLLRVNGDPLYAVGAYGRGEVAVFMSELAGSWNAAWSLNDSCDALVRRIVLSSTRTDRPATSIAVSTEQNGKTASIRIETASEGVGYQPEVHVKFADKEIVTEIRQIGRELYEATFDAETPGKYDLSLMLSDDDGNLVDFYDSALIVPYGREYDVFYEGGLGLLQDLAALTGGEALQSYEDTQILGDVDMGTVTYTRSLLLPLGIAAAVLFLIDVTLRRIRPRQKKNA